MYLLVPLMVPVADEPNSMDCFILSAFLFEVEIE